MADNTPGTRFFDFCKSGRAPRPEPTTWERMLKSFPTSHSQSMPNDTSKELNGMLLFGSYFGNLNDSIILWIEITPLDQLAYCAAH